MATQVATVDSEEWVPAIGLGDRLRVVRRRKHRSQEEMAALLGVKKVTYASWEAGMASPAYDVAVRIAKRLYMLDRVPQWWTLGADDPTDNLSYGARSSTDRASDYGSEVGVFRARPTTHRRGRRRTDVPGPRHLSIVASAA